MAKRGNHEGTIWKLKDGSGFKGAVRLGIDADGRPIRKYVQRKTRGEVQKEIKHLTRKLELKQPVHSAKRTVGHFMQQWLEVHVRPNNAPLTYRGYEQTARMYIIPVLGKIPLETLNGQDVQQCLNRAAKGGLSPTSVKAINATLKTALSTAKRWQYVDRNVAKDATPPKQRKFEAQALTAEQGGRLLKVIKGHRYEAIIVVALLMGLRRGEVAGLRWSNIDLIDRMLHVCDSLQRLPRLGLVMSTVKTKKSKRRIPIPQMCVDALIRRQKIQLEEKIAAGETWKQDSDFVFTSRYGARIVIEELSRELDAALTLAELPHIRFHDLRHSTASILLALGVPMKIVQEILGHSNFQVTADLYTHVLPSALTDAAETMNRAFTVAEEENEQKVAVMVAPIEAGTIQ